jgi:EmrB/QacA subfamily drug resistance transporter
VHRPEGQMKDVAKWFALLTVGIGTFMSALNGSVVNAVLPVMRRGLHADFATIELVVTIYLLVVSGLLLLFGRLGDLRGHRTWFVSGLAGFAAASGLCCLAPDATFLILFRALQAIAAAMMFANSPAILTKSFPPEQRGQALGLQATMTYLGLTVGPSLGGLLAQRWGWRAVFAINVPIGAVAVFMALRFVQRETIEERGGVDVKGAALLFAGLGGLLLALHRGRAWSWGPPVIALLAASTVLLALFVAVERRARSPLLDLALFRERAFSAASASALLNYIAVYGILFLFPFYLIEVRGLGPARAGLLLTAQPLVMTVAAPLSGIASDRIGTRIPTTLGMALLAAGLLWLSRLDPRTPLIEAELALVLCGLGTGIFIAPNNSGLMGAAPRARQGIAAGVLATARNVGMAMGVGLAGAIFTTALRGEEGPGAVSSAIDAGFLAAALAAALGAATSAIRGPGAARAG